MFRVDVSQCPTVCMRCKNRIEPGGGHFITIDVPNCGKVQIQVCDECNEKEKPA